MIILYSMYVCLCPLALIVLLFLSLINMSVSSLDRVWYIQTRVSSLYSNRQYKCLMPIKHWERKRRERKRDVVLVVAFCIRTEGHERTHTYVCRSKNKSVERVCVCVRVCMSLLNNYYILKRRGEKKKLLVLHRCIIKLLTLNDGSYSLEKKEETS